MGKVTVEGTNEPVIGATIQVLLATITDGRHATVTGKSGANGRYSIDTPIGNVEIWNLELPPGYWSQIRMENVITSAESPVLTKDFAVHRGPVWRVRAWDATAARPIPAIQCVVTRIAEEKSATCWSDTDTQGIARATLEGFHGEFQMRLNDFKHQSRWQAEAASLTIERGFHVDQISQITEEKKDDTFRSKDKYGKHATLRHGRVSLIDGEVLIQLDAKPTIATAGLEVRGTVVDQNGRPLAGARVAVAHSWLHSGGFETSFSAITAGDGGFMLRDLWIPTSDDPTFRLNLVITKKGYGGIDTPRRAVPAAKVPIDFGPISLSPGKSVNVRVLDHHGKPVVGAWVEPGGNYSARAQIATTDDRGECVVRDLPSGLTDVSVSYGDSYANGLAVVGDAMPALTLRLKPLSGLQAISHRQPPHPIELGKPAPALTVAEWSDGKTRSLSDYRGKVVVLDFWGIWCSACINALPAIKNLEAKYKDRGVVFLSIHTAGTDMKQVRAFQRQQKLDFLTAVEAGDEVADGPTSKAYGIRGYPALIVIGRDGRVESNSELIREKDGMKLLERAAKAQSIPWPINEAQPQEKLIEQMCRMQEFIFSEAIDHALARP